MRIDGNQVAPPSMRRRLALALGAAALVVPLLSLSQQAQAQAKKPLIDVWKSPTCGCCKEWMDHLEAAGFATRAHDKSAARSGAKPRAHGADDARTLVSMPQKYASCHTGRIGGYAIEGHVPAADIRRLLREKPDALGLAVPGMPIGSPGMDSPDYGHQHDAYEVLLVLKDGSSRVFSSYPAKEITR